MFLPVLVFSESYKTLE